MGRIKGRTEKSREDGVLGWLLHTNAGVVTSLVAAGLVMLAAFGLPWARWYHHDSVHVAVGLLITVAVLVAMWRGAVRTIRGD